MKRTKRWLLGGFLLLAACKKDRPQETTPNPTTSASAAVAPASASATSKAAPREKLARYTGSSVGRSSKALFVADEDGGVVRSFALPLATDDKGSEYKAPGRPAQVLAVGQRVLVTVRDPGLLLVMSADPATHALAEESKIALPADAWGMAVTQDESLVAVTSAWTHKVSLVDLKTGKVKATVDVAREPRGVVFTPDGRRLYVSHLMGTDLTRIDLDGEQPKVSRVALPAGPLFAQSGVPNSASLGYALAITDDGKRLYAPRHALGAIERTRGSLWGISRWWGAAAVDGLWLADDSPLTPPRSAPGPRGDDGKIPASGGQSFTQPRDALYRASTRTLLIASEGEDAINEQDIDAIDPGMSGTFYRFGRNEKTDNHFMEHMNAPQGLVLSSDESRLYVWARASREVVELRLSGGDGKGDGETKVVKASFAPPPGDKEKDKIEQGRKIFYTASDSRISGGLACAGCHPEGRDDGFVWHEVQLSNEGLRPDSFEARNAEAFCFVGNPMALGKPKNDGHPRQTPTLAGRIASQGPFGWHAQNKNIHARIEEGFQLHRWCNKQTPLSVHALGLLVNPLVAFLRSGGLHAPPRDASPLTPEEERGKAIFNDDKTQCKSCHPGETEYTTRAVVPLSKALATRPGFAPEENQLFKVPSLFFVGGTPPYYHDGSARTLEELIQKNGNQMGDTSHLSPADQAALVAFLKRL